MKTGVSKDAGKVWSVLSSSGIGFGSPRHPGKPSLTIHPFGVDTPHVSVLRAGLVFARETALPSRPAYTTVADWRGYSPVEWNGVWYGQKAQEFMRIIDLPRRSTR